MLWKSSWNALGSIESADNVNGVVSLICVAVKLLDWIDGLVVLFRGGRVFFIFEIINPPMTTNLVTEVKRFIHQNLQLHPVPAVTFFAISRQTTAWPIFGCLGAVEQDTIAPMPCRMEGGRGLYPSSPPR